MHRRLDTCSAAFIWKWPQHAGWGGEPAAPCRMRSSEGGAEQGSPAGPTAETDLAYVSARVKDRALLKHSAPVTFLIVVTHQSSKLPLHDPLLVLLRSTGFTSYRSDWESKLILRHNTIYRIRRENFWKERKKKASRAPDTCSRQRHS